MLCTWYVVGDWRNGRWTAEELRTLKRNVEDFMKVVYVYVPDGGKGTGRE